VAGGPRPRGPDRQRCPARARARARCRRPPERGGPLLRRVQPAGARARRHRRADAHRLNRVRRRGRRRERTRHAPSRARPTTWVTSAPQNAPTAYRRDRGVTDATRSWERIASAPATSTRPSPPGRRASPGLVGAPAPGGAARPRRHAPAAAGVAPHRGPGAVVDLLAGGGEPGGDDARHQGGELLLVDLAADDPHEPGDVAVLAEGRLVVAVRRAHSGMFPCFLAGSCARLVRSARSPRTIWARVSDGAMTAST